MTSSTQFCIKLTREEKNTLDDAAEIFKEILEHLVANKKNGLAMCQDSFVIYDAFHQIYNICNEIEVGVLMPEKKEMVI